MSKLVIIFKLDTDKITGEFLEIKRFEGILLPFIWCGLYSSLVLTVAWDVDPCNPQIQGLGVWRWHCRTLCVNRDVIFVPSKLWDRAYSLSITRIDVISIPSKLWDSGYGVEIALISGCCEMATEFQVFRKIGMNPRYCDDSLNSFYRCLSNRIEV